MQGQQVGNGQLPQGVMAPNGRLLSFGKVRGTAVVSQKAHGNVRALDFQGL